MVTEILWQLSKACGKKSPCLVATGGYAPAVLRDAGFEIDLQPDLTLWGVARIAERNL
jgi:pantothenate kinase type III